MHVTLSPAYGRDYKNKAQIAADLLAEKDFVLHAHTGDTYVNLPQLEGFCGPGTPVREINVRYAAMRKVCVLPFDRAKLAAIANPKPRKRIDPKPLEPNERTELGWLIDQIVGSLHVSTSDQDVCKRIWKGRPGLALDRKKFVLADQLWVESRALATHAANRELYRKVQSGTF